ncbi:hypothetical protein L1987_58980 [Smallanthus sonchifolius]|uniref:Uncharacterized protein n=1 Tax=Smallanthus sonchifolius TaxID=185202 RepID=A0ACB9D3W1_9ASTR|nr:hypothetical protein L1987_58980 [Smallanthus sonchifolius]
MFYSGWIIIKVVLCNNAGKVKVGLVLSLGDGSVGSAGSPFSRSPPRAGSSPVKYPSHRDAISAKDHSCLRPSKKRCAYQQCFSQISSPVLWGVMIIIQHRSNNCKSPTFFKSLSFLILSSVCFFRVF